MKAIRIHDYGDPAVLRCEKAPEPTLLPDDFLVRVSARLKNRPKSRG